MKTQRAQTATEYLIILAVVIIIALIVVGVLGGIPGIGGSAGSSALDAYWKTNGKIGVDALAVRAATGVSDAIVLRNLQDSTIQITSVELGTASANLSLGISTQVVSAGQTVTISNTTMPSNVLQNFFPCVAGEKFTAYIRVNYTFVSTQTPYTFTGDGNKLEGTCAN